MRYLNLQVCVASCEPLRRKIYLPEVVTFDLLQDAFVDIRDFQTTGVVAFAKGLPFTKMNAGNYALPGRDRIQIKADNLDHCTEAMNLIVAKL